MPADCIIADTQASINLLADLHLPDPVIDVEFICRQIELSPGLRLVPVEQCHLIELEGTMRFADRIEIRDLNPGVTVNEALQISAETSTWCVALLDAEDRVICVGGLGISQCGNGVPWLLGSDFIAKNSFGFLAASRQLVDLMLQQTGTLFNCCDRRNIAARRWLSWLGFKFLPDPKGKKPGLALYFHKSLGE